MRLLPHISWTPDDGSEPIDPRLIKLLAAIGEQGSLAAACTTAAVPYRSAWGVLREAGRRVGRPLVVMERGRGARLTPEAQAWLGAHAAAIKRLGDAALVVGAGEAMPLPPLRMAASHDLALAQLRDALPASGPLALEVSFMGSLDALEAYARGRVDLAGFHVAEDAIEENAMAAIRRSLRPNRDRLVHFAVREQGLIVPTGNPRRVRGFADVAEKGLRFVNRQPGSGTRMLVDALLAREDIAPGQIDGYDRTERNHIAAAASVASGGADVAFGLRAAAAEYGLAFVPLARERYRVAVRLSILRSPAMEAFIAALRGPLLRRTAERLPGYDVARAGAVETLASLKMR
jgi:molybdate transport repressor ModE-like protein